MARSSAGESALHRHMRILSAFDTLRPFLTLTNIASATGMTASTVHRLVGDLEREGLLERMPDRTYRLGLRLWEFAAHSPGAPGLREIARTWLAAVHNRLRQHVQLGIRTGTDVLFIDRMSHPDGVVNMALIGGRVPLHASSTGLVLLAHAPQAAVDTVVATGMRVFTPHTIHTQAQLTEALQRVRADGFAVADGHLHEESRGVAVPVKGPDATVYAALSAVMPNDGTSPLPVIEILTIAAKGIEQGLREAYSPAPTLPGRYPQHGVSARSLEYIARMNHGHVEQGRS